MSPKSECFFRKFPVEQVLKSFPGRTNYLNPPVCRIYYSLSFGMEESRELTALIRWFLGNSRHTKMPKHSAFFFLFLAVVLDLLTALNY